MRKIGRQIAALVVASGVGVAACGSSGGSAVAPTATVKATAAATTPTARATPTRPGSGTATVPVAAGSPKPTTIPLRVVRQGGAALVLADITVGTDKLVFIVDTGASTTLIDSRVATRLRLPRAGLPIKISGVAGAASGQPVRLVNWRIGGSKLPARIVISSPLTLGGGSLVAGLLGSDVLASFGAVTIDYKKQRGYLGG